MTKSTLRKLNNGSLTYRQYLNLRVNQVQTHRKVQWIAQGGIPKVTKKVTVKHYSF